MVVIGLGKNLLFKSVLAHCDLALGNVAKLVFESKNFFSVSLVKGKFEGTREFLFQKIGALIALSLPT